MTEPKSLVIPAEQSNGSMNFKEEMDAAFWKLKKKRLNKLRKSRQKCAERPLIEPFKIYRHEAEGLNGAEVYLFLEELQIFTRTLIEYPVLFPLNYSQQVSLEGGMYCIRLKSEEAFEDFAGRLSKALSLLE